MTRQEDGSVLFAVYGTLKQGHGNYNHYLRNREGVRFLGELKTEPKYTMYSMGGFPGVAEGGDTAIVVEVFRVENEDVIRGINSLEGYSGVRNSAQNWYDTCELPTPWGIANMFTQNDLIRRRGMQGVVASGDWNKRY